MKGPLVKLAGRELLRDGDNLIEGGLARSAVRFNNYLEQVPLSPEEMKQFLSFRLRTVWHAKERSRWWGGRLLNLLTYGDPDYLEMSGARVGEVLDLAGYEVPDILDVSLMYHVRRDIVEEAFTNLGRNPMSEADQ
ncbi:MAG: hypothetical protein ABJJ37_10700 [Roseibium sp.]